MLYTDADFRVKGDSKVEQIGLTVDGSGSFIAYIPKQEDEDTYLQFVLSIEKKNYEMILVTAAPVVNGQVGVTTEMSFRARDIRATQSLEDLREKMAAEVNKNK